MDALRRNTVEFQDEVFLTEREHESEIDRLKSENKSLVQSLLRAKLVNKELKIDMEKFGPKIKNDLDTERLENEKLRQRISDLTRIIKDKEQEVDYKTDEIDQLKKELEMKDREITMSRQNFVDDLIEEVAAGKEDIKNLNTEIGRMLQINCNLTYDLEKYLHDIDDLKRENRKLKETGSKGGAVGQSRRIVGQSINIGRKTKDIGRVSASNTDGVLSSSGSSSKQIETSLPNELSAIDRHQQIASTGGSITLISTPPSTPVSACPIIPTMYYNQSTCNLHQMVAVDPSESSNTHQWDHPKFADIKQAIDDCNYIAYAKYRLASKFRVLQRCLYVEEVPLSIISSTFAKHRMCKNEGSLTLETCDLEALLSDIYFAANKQNHTNIDVDFATEILINFLYNVFDCNRDGKIQVVSVKILLGLLCHGSPSELHKYLFLLYTDHNNCITRIRLQGLLNKILEIIKYVHEDTSFGDKSLHLAVENCFQDFPGLVGITENNFLCWFDLDIPFLSWMPLILKLKSAETIIHSTKCTTCNTRPILGLRYRCVKCLRYTQCQRCFLTGRISHSHKLSHSLREYHGASANKGNNGFMSKITGVFCPKYADRNYSIVKPARQMGVENIKHHSSDVLCEVLPLSAPEIQLQTVIRQLESQNRELQQMLIFGNYNEKDLRKYLEEYRYFMAGNIKKLKFLKVGTILNQINNQERTLVQYPISHDIHSTPMQQPNKVDGKDENSDIKYYGSPITTAVVASIEENLEAKNKRFNYYYKGYNTPPISEQPKSAISKSPVKLLQNDLDEALARLQQILANNFSLEDSFNMDNFNLKYAVTEVEGMLTSIIDNVESSRCSSALNGRTKT
ncbi:unnamed protein product [Ceutorhynchus assimilis]|uniref:ZZ-type domain-containing protein n=1 Tax=Ceutorhynchus assimilis TaxID=467358 RepID=A0A9N9MS31_9CUCU|nr:unnamed protein product [Ceutorhynchus assimilis]